MRTPLQIAFMCWAGVKDVRLSTWFINLGGPKAELNGIALYLFESLGSWSLAGLKVVLLAAFVAIMIAVRRRHRRTGERLLLAGTVISAGLMMWWDVVLWTLRVA